jgi:uncharacterized Zn-binding protein involved in type VI secretion
MPPICRAGIDINTGHGSFPPDGVAVGSPDVFSNSAPTHRVGDSEVGHASPSPSGFHAGVCAAGSPNVFANSKAVARIGDPVSCGECLATGSGNIFVN